KGRSGNEFILSGQVELLALASGGNASASGNHDHEPARLWVILRIADEYERLADMADRENTRNAPVQALPETSWLANDGVDPRTVQSYLGPRSIQHTVTGPAARKSCSTARRQKGLRPLSQACPSGGKRGKIDSSEMLEAAVL